MNSRRAAKCVICRAHGVVGEDGPVRASVMVRSGLEDQPHCWDCAEWRGEDRKTLLDVRVNPATGKVWKAADILMLELLRVIDRLGTEFANRIKGDEPALSYEPAHWAMAGDVSAEFDAPYKVVMAKCQRLINSKMITGCTCGCRGDFELTSRGRNILNAADEIEQSIRNWDKPTREPDHLDELIAEAMPIEGAREGLRGVILFQLRMAGLGADDVESVKADLDDDGVLSVEYGVKLREPVTYVIGKGKIA